MPLTGRSTTFDNCSGQIRRPHSDVERFSILALGSGDHGFHATVMNLTLDEVSSRPPLLFTREMLHVLNPRTRSMTSFRRPEELEVALGIHRLCPILDFEEGANLWGISYHTLFNSTTASGHFLKKGDLVADGWTLGQNNVFRRGEEVALPLYEGQLVNRYDHRARTYEGYIGANKYGKKPNIPWTTDEQKGDPSFENEPRYWMHDETAEARLQQTVGQKAIVAIRDVGAPWTNQRSARGALLPRRPATHACPVLAVPLDLVIEFMGVLNASVFDFLVRGHMPSGHVALTWMLAQIAAPEPGLDPRIAANAERLSLTSYSVAELFGKEPYRWDPEERYRLDVETDALVALAYGLDCDQYEIVLDSFEVMARVQTQEHGYYKFKEDCLADYDRLKGES